VVTHDVESSTLYPSRQVTGLSERQCWLPPVPVYSQNCRLCQGVDGPRAADPVPTHVKWMMSPLYTALKSRQLLLQIAESHLTNMTSTQAKSDEYTQKILKKQLLFQIVLYRLMHGTIPMLYTRDTLYNKNCYSYKKIKAMSIGVTDMAYSGRSSDIICSSTSLPQQAD